MYTHARIYTLYIRTDIQHHSLSILFIDPSLHLSINSCILSFTDRSDNRRLLRRPSEAVLEKKLVLLRNRMPFGSDPPPPIPTPTASAEGKIWSGEGRVNSIVSGELCLKGNSSYESIQFMVMHNLIVFSCEIMAFVTTSSVRLTSICPSSHVSFSPFSNSSVHSSSLPSFNLSVRPSSNPLYVERADWLEEER